MKLKIIINNDRSKILIVVLITLSFYSERNISNLVSSRNFINIIFKTAVERNYVALPDHNNI